MVSGLVPYIPGLPSFLLGEEKSKTRQVTITHKMSATVLCACVSASSACVHARSLQSCPTL